MLGYFEPLPGGGASIALDEAQVSILRSFAVQLLELIGPGQDAVGGADPLDALFAEGPTEPPSDPALARLFPDAYVDPAAPLPGPGDSEAARAAEEARAASAEFRRYTENDLRARKREDALAVVRSLDAVGSRLAAEREAGDGGDGGEGATGPAAVLELDPELSRRWLGTLNDLRLAVGTRLEVSDEADGSELLRLPDSDPRKPMAVAYIWLGELQETLVETL
ncbi:DUF2017 domain-containing protein [Streptomyces palmae]|uniref:DUF2017 domain-containing protein n=1 Tax=Streptomyces palmae TaxID=1701085 RepID=A0A4Z0HAN6_9ACTN|nr:DUF2017 domain-containing protein [Streptomyces palmae]TGB08280.1 DUF2017 domain-containing protein [Streptomyces palmae]